MPTAQVLPRNMIDAQIESELKPGYCTLGDVLAFLEEAPKKYKDGNWNLFYTPAFVVSVRWNGDEWRVSAWGRDGRGWDADSRVFSPATNSKALKSKPLDTLTLPDELNINGVIYRKVK